ncbi:uncharacterized protein B0T15DRAFT_502946 [Chaetomium strumarium]|uniref:Uncharacterized protein n=1 Tax=Chaetomium strumarium TaxID=1170767 RepID=A0AAJ0GTJ0_9PEZI|nr:hypothetical protein B0T15DRAFT_502946 [Chaetomium strumarium]
MPFLNTVTKTMSPANRSVERPVDDSSPPEMQQRESQPPGGRPLRPGDLDGLSQQEKQDEIKQRARYLVKDQLEPSSVPWHFPRPQPPSNLPYVDFVARIHRDEREFYPSDLRNYPRCKFNGANFVASLHQTHRLSFRGRLEEHSVVLDKVVHFARRDVPGEVCPYSEIPSRPDAMEEKRKEFGKNVAGAFGIQSVSYYAPEDGDEYLEGIKKVDKHTLVLDTTFNSSILKVIQEANLNPGVIIKQFRFWPDGADEDAESLNTVRESDYGLTHWLSEYYEVFVRYPGCGFVTCYPTIYIRKSVPLVPLVPLVPRYSHTPLGKLQCPSL